jgi:hypothetical protein
MFRIDDDFEDTCESKSIAPHSKPEGREERAFANGARERA